ncbi:hypothetical protein NUW54_g5510 [Trametes sanguinea]|uniref:Uncharacterized protein n=1 Tax=Trametes sanguinea TaxID=158606 RepID=A0ACC1PVY1_9APHY|nr:hypothetical protein NUW54_g5510 [Trametes sanguinea]
MRRHPDRTPDGGPELEGSHERETVGDEVTLPLQNLRCVFGGCAGSDRVGYSLYYSLRHHLRPARAISALTATVSTTDANSAYTQTAYPTLRRHARCWLDDGSLIVRAQDEIRIYKVHGTLLDRHPKILALLRPSSNGNDNNLQTVEGMVVVHIPGVRGEDFEALLEHSYHDAPLNDSSSFPKVASILRASSNPARFLQEYTHSRALVSRICLRWVRKSPSRPSMLKRLLRSRYAKHYTTASQPIRTITTRIPLISYFTPILFHMACTDVLAEKWMPLVIQTALDDHTLCRPLETLERIIRD